MRRLLRSLAGQWLALLLLTMLLAHGVAVGLLALQGGSVQIHPLALRNVQTQLAVAYRLAITQPQLADTLLLVLDSPTSHITRSTVMPALPPQGQQTALVQSIRVQLPDAPAVYATLQQGEARLADPADEPTWALEIAIALPDGYWLHARHTPVMMHPHWERVLPFSLVTSVVSSVLLAFFFGRSIMRPLTALAQAAQRFSRGEAVAALALQGPYSVRAIIAAFNDMQERISRFVKDRTQLLAAIGHDLRTPLASLRIRAEMIPDADLRAAMCKSVDEMGAMVAETLQFARDDAVVEETCTVDLISLVDEVVQHQCLLGKRVYWQTPLQAQPCTCRPVQIKRALHNLIDNAARHGQVWVRVRVDAGQYHITIADDGPGIDPARLEQVFAPFVRLDAARKLDGNGSGLGLSVARSLIRAHGGEVTLHNRPEGGLCVEVTLPGADGKSGRH